MHKNFHGRLQHARSTLGRNSERRELCRGRDTGEFLTQCNRPANGLSCYFRENGPKMTVFRLWPENGTPYEKFTRIKNWPPWLVLSSGGNTEALHTQTNSPGGAKLSRSAKITHSGSIWGFITRNLLRQPQNAIHRWKGLWCGHDMMLNRWRHCYICVRQEARNEKKIVREKRKPPKKFLRRG